MFSVLCPCVAVHLPGSHTNLCFRHTSKTNQTILRLYVQFESPWVSGSLAFYVTTWEGQRSFTRTFFCFWSYHNVSVCVLALLLQSSLNHWALRHCSWLWKTFEPFRTFSVNCGVQEVHVYHFHFFNETILFVQKLFKGSGFYLLSFENTTDLTWICPLTSWKLSWILSFTSCRKVPKRHELLTPCSGVKTEICVIAMARQKLVFFGNSMQTLRAHLFGVRSAQQLFREFLQCIGGSAACFGRCHAETETYCPPCCVWFCPIQLWPQCSSNLHGTRNYRMQIQRLQTASDKRQICCCAVPVVQLCDRKKENYRLQRCIDSIRGMSFKRPATKQIKNVGLFFFPILLGVYFLLDNDIFLPVCRCALWRISTFPFSFLLQVFAAQLVACSEYRLQQKCSVLTKFSIFDKW